MMAEGALASGPVYADFVSMVNSLTEVVYNENASFVVSPKTRAFILSNVKDTNGRPIYKFDSNGQLFLLGKPVYVSDYFATYAASTVQALYGNFSLAYQYQYFNRLRTNKPFPERMVSQVSIETRFAGTPTQVTPKAVVSLTTAAS